MAMSGAVMKVEANLPHITQDRDRHGNARIYYRIEGRPMIRLRARLGSPEFLAEYQRAKEATAAASVKPLLQTTAIAASLRWVVEQYYKSAWFKTLALSTQKARRGILDSICESTTQTPAGIRQRGVLPLAQMKAKHVRAIRDEKMDLPEAANGRLKALGQVFAYALEQDFVEVDPTATVDFLTSASEGYHTWTVDEVRAYEKKHPIGTKARLALALLLFTGVRRSDVVKLGRQMERDGILHFTETKGAASRALSRKTKRPSAKTRVLPILPELREVIDASPLGQMVYLVTAFNKPFTAAGFGNRFRDWCDEAGLNHCSAHGLRKAGATIAADNGATAHQLMSIFGWETLRQAGTYTKNANRTRLASEAMHLLVPRGRNKQG
jgi:integrase